MVMIGALRVNPIALRMAKIVYNFGLSECNRVKVPEKQTTKVSSAKFKECLVKAIAF